MNIVNARTIPLIGISKFIGIGSFFWFDLTSTKVNGSALTEVINDMLQGWIESNAVSCGLSIFGKSIFGTSTTATTSTAESTTDPVVTEVSKLIDLCVTLYTVSLTVC